MNLTKLIVFFSDNYFISYNHLHEQPTVFYAVTLALAILGDNHPYTLQAAWTYVGLRIVHSVFQSLVNKVMVIREMNRIGMIVDCSHVSEDAARQALECTRAPVMFSHSNAKSVFDCARNVSDAVLDLIPRNGGIIMVTFVPEFVATRRRDARLEDVVDHLFYIANRIGWDHVGLGSDFDGIASVISGLEDVRCYPALLKVILDRGATEEQLAKVAGENMLRVWRGVEEVRDQMQAEGVLPVEDVWEGRKWWRYDGVSVILVGCILLGNDD